MNLSIDINYTAWLCVGSLVALIGTVICKIILEEREYLAKIKKRHTEYALNNWLWTMKARESWLEMNCLIRSHLDFEYQRHLEAEIGAYGLYLLSLDAPNDAELLHMEWLSGQANVDYVANVPATGPECKRR